MKKYAKIIALMIVLVTAAISLMGCGTQSTLEKIEKSGKLTVITEAGFAPFEYMNGGEIDGVDVVIECVGNTIATAQAFSATKRGTTVLLFSVPKSGTTHPLSLEDVYQKELTIVGSIINPDTHQRAVDLINSGRIQLAPILTHRFPIERLKDAILMQMSSESLKVLVGSNYD